MSDRMSDDAGMSAEDCAARFCRCGALGPTARVSDRMTAERLAEIREYFGTLGIALVNDILAELDAVTKERDGMRALARCDQRLTENGRRCSLDRDHGGSHIYAPEVSR